jgi:hypothetical protein
LLQASSVEKILDKLKSRIFDESNRSCVLDWVEKAIHTRIQLQMNTLLGLHDTIVQLKNGKPIHPKENERVTKDMNLISDILDTFYASNQNAHQKEDGI